MIRKTLLRGYRAGILILVVLFLRYHHLELSRQTDHPVTVAEVKELLTEAKSLMADYSDREGWYVLDEAGNRIGYALRTSPVSDFLIGYCGSTDTLIVLDQDNNVIGFQIRSSGDTTSHVRDVKRDEYFMNILKEMSWNRIADLDLEEEEIEGVSGATMTSINVIETIRYRFQYAENQATQKPTFKWKKEDWILSLLLAGSLILGFSRLRKIKPLRFTFHLLIFIYLGLVFGNMISIGLMFGWSAAGVPWHLSAGLFLILAASILVPWSTKRPLYCTQICPHGLAQQWLGNLPVRKRKISKRWDRILRIIPPLLIAYAFFIYFLQIPVELAEIEAFNAYTFSHSGWASIILAVVGLIASVFYRLPYCHYGCPTGAVLGFIRSHGRADRFQKKDWIALGLLLLTGFLYWNAQFLTNWIYR